MPAAINATMQTAMARILSRPPIVGAEAAAGAGAGRMAETGAAPRWMEGVATGAAGMADDAPVGPPGGSVGNLMVGAAVGLGGKLMRTVSFFGWTRPVVFFIGGIAPAGPPGVGGRTSAISIVAQR